MLKTILIALILCIIEILVIVIASPMAKPSIVLRFLPEDVRLAAANHPEPPKGKQMTLRFVVFLYVMKAFDILVQDQWLVLTIGYFKKLYPETAECEGWKDRGFNNKNQIIRIVTYPILCMITAGIFMLFR